MSPSFFSKSFSKRSIRITSLGSAVLVGAIALAACGGEPSSSPNLSSEESSTPASEESGEAANPTDQPADALGSSPNEDTSSTSTAREENTTANSTDSVNIGKFTADDLFAAGGGGCGLSLKPVGGGWQDGSLFFHGLDSEPAFMKIDDTMIQLTRTSSQGDAFYGQQLEQTFKNGDGSLSVEVRVTLGEPGEIESVNIPEGLMVINQAGTTVEIPVEGDAGC